MLMKRQKLLYIQVEDMLKYSMILRILVRIALEPCERAMKGGCLKSVGV